MSVLRQHSHKHVVKMLSPPFTDASYRLFQTFELCHGDFMTVVERTGGVVDERIARRVFQQVVLALQHCHRHGVYHLDVKPDNILLIDTTVKLGDFGSAWTDQDHNAPILCKPCTLAAAASPASITSTVTTGDTTPCTCTQRGWTSQPCGTIVYACPEALEIAQEVLIRPAGSAAGSTNAEEDDLSYDAASADVWALAVSMFAVMMGSYPWERAVPDDSVYMAWVDAWNRVDVVDASGAKDRASLSEAAITELSAQLLSGHARTVSAPLLSLLVGMLDPCRETRFGLDDVVKHPWLQMRSGRGPCD
jgi:serine/threonine protein kinase